MSFCIFTKSLIIFLYQHTQQKIIFFSFKTDVYFESDGHFLQPSHSPDYPDILDSAGHISNLERDFLEYDYNQFEEDENDTQIFQERYLHLSTV